MTVADLLRKRRTELGFTQQSLASKAGVAQSTVAMIEQGKRKPSPAVAQKLAKPLRMKWVLFFDDPSRNCDKAS